MNNYSERIIKIWVYMRCVDKSHDVVQSVFVKLWDKKDDLSDVSNWKSYLFFSVRNACIDEIRKQKYDLEIDEKLSALDDINHSSSFLEANELSYYIEEALKTLPKKCYLVFSLKRFDGLTNAQVAEELDISPKTVENQFTTALKRIREYLAQFGLP